MKLWLLTSEFPPDHASGGISTYSVQCAKAFQSSGHNISVFAPAPEGQAETAEETAEEGYTIVRVPPRALGGIEHSLGHWLLLSYCFAEEVVRRLQGGAQPPDMIEVPDYAALGYFLQKRKLLGEPVLERVPIVVMSHTPVYEVVRANADPTYRLPNYWIGRCERYSLLAADQVLCPSRFLAKKVLDETGLEAELCPLPAASLFGGAGQQTGVTDTDLLYVGRFQVLKGVLKLLHAMKMVWDAGHEIKLTMIGGDTLLTAEGTGVWQYVSDGYSEYIDRGVLVLHSTAERETIWAMMCRAKALVVPSLFENFPYVCIEGMSVGIPIIASRTGGQADMVGDDGSCGAVFDWSVDGSFVDAVHRVMSLSDQQRAKVGTNARERISDYCDPAKFVQRRLAALRKIALTKVERAKAYPFLNQHLECDRKTPGYDASTEAAGGGVLLSVVIVHGDCDEDLRASVDAIAKSTHKDLEIIVASLGPGSSPIDPLCVPAPEHCRPVRIVSSATGSLSDARQAGVRAAEGEFVAFLASGDLVEPSYFEKCTTILSSYKNASSVYSWTECVGDADRIAINFDTELPYMLFKNMMAPSFVIRRRDVDKCGFAEKAPSHVWRDHDAMLRLVGRGCLGISIPEPLVRTRSQLCSEDRTVGSGASILTHEHIATLNAELYARWGPEIFQLLNANGPGWTWDDGSECLPPAEGAGSEIMPRQWALMRRNLSPEQLQQITSLLQEPAFVWLVRAVIASRLHRPMLWCAKAVWSIVRRTR